MQTLQNRYGVEYNKDNYVRQSSTVVGSKISKTNRTDTQRSRRESPSQHLCSQHCENNINKNDNHTQEPFRPHRDTGLYDTQSGTKPNPASDLDNWKILESYQAPNAQARHLIRSLRRYLCSTYQFSQHRLDTGSSRDTNTLVSKWHR